MLGNSNDATELAQFVSQLTDHQSVIRGYIRTLIPNASDIRDVLQNTNIALWERRSEFKTGTNFKAWAFTIARYRALEHRRAMRKDKDLVFDDELIDLLSSPSTDFSAAQHERKQVALDSCLQQLKDKDRNLIHARYFQNANLEEYAKIDGRSYGSIRVILNRLRITLRNCVDAKTSATNSPA
ncbi:sigma-70 family RNA polymerase sigma factor [Rubritalea tangerina]|uniref:Sigma-70 family RNA polymerase sigma factor n=1 Tax=Rubritalea tangerina TaxID=430798 RepID=A0ABW4ZB77_9BACT